MLVGNRRVFSAAGRLVSGLVGVPPPLAGGVCYVSKTARCSLCGCRSSWSVCLVKAHALWEENRSAGRRHLGLPASDSPSSYQPSVSALCLFINITHLAPRATVCDLASRMMADVIGTGKGRKGACDLASLLSVREGDGGRGGLGCRLSIRYELARFVPNPGVRYAAAVFARCFAQVHFDRRLRHAWLSAVMSSQLSPTV